MIEIENFQPGKYVQNGKFRCFVPSAVNDEWIWRGGELNVLLESAAHALGELKALSLQAPNVDLFISLSASAEATVSSRIEGTKTEFDEAMQPEPEIHPERRDDFHEVRNYIAALQEALEREPRLPVSSRMICRAHKTLMQGVRGKNKDPGAFRRVQNYLGDSEENPVFVPPPPQMVDELMSDLEKFLHNDRIKLPALMRIAIAHYQFETIHPFMDGNGRIGRLIIPFYLTEKGMTDKPLLYMSRYLERNKGRYYDNLMRARGGDIARWLAYFLRGAQYAAETTTRALTDMMRLRDSARATIKRIFARSESAAVLLESLFRRPVVSIEDAARECGITRGAARTLIGKMREAGLLRELTARHRNRLFVFREYLDIFER